MSTKPTHVIVVGASAGGVEALREFVSGLPPDLPAAVLVVLHLPSGGTSVLATTLQRVAPIPARPAHHGAPLAPGIIYTAVPDHHLLVTAEHIVLSHGPSENGHRPGIDALFRSAAMTWDCRVAGVVLSGSLDDGTAGLALIKSRGGLAAVQEPTEALYRSMPDNALAHVAADLVLPARELGAAVSKSLVERIEFTAAPPSELDRLEARIDAGGLLRNEVTTMAQPAGLSCPDCNGSLYALADGKRYRCRVGHAWTAEALLLEQSLEVEKALWTALRALEERRHLADRMRADAQRHGDDRMATRFADQSAENSHAAEILRKLLVDRRAD
ncbi:chemotaxis protein CheB [Nocardia sp. CDC159]|uniref:protein-glutamate methylesterase n=1 Tax=Nocardia pulmonis TaxID=2951408 RepID=A0A9X2EEG7_9NOCA|nr:MULTISPECIES: chemotaxis protein CheB [Nocardia]MCM6777960.1 chemotaxis protein CheB [Nocardia pulmonis]MCM6790869.1 chemotaxis protein CheB [Nocardia sp. CDC159]